MMKLRHLLYALLTLLIISCRTVNNPTVNPEPLKPAQFNSSVDAYPVTTIRI